ncbi:MAG TPA: CDP-6-deoxy-delta-3,4-glucoseen reductase [Rhodocyclaceae bacterium]|nr:CDP-6-deoxy-delta-3,4-glucoseen reductase [Rhodocyclaceae bacterium]
MAFNATLRPSGHTYAVPEGETLLQAALDAGLTVPYGCRNGACGACKGKVLEGRVDLGGAQDSALSPADRDEGLLLFCCARPLTDVIVECREVRSLQDIPVRTLPCRVQKMEKLAPDVMALYLKLPANERLQYLAGQYLEFLLKDGKRRAFSIANAPHDDELLELHVRMVPGGQFTGHVFATMKERDILRIEGPLGSFFLREESKKPAVLLAGGTGFAPIKALVEHAIHNHMTRPMHVYWGARDRTGLYLPDLGDAWAGAHAHITYVPVLSDATPEDAWAGRTGLVHRAVLEDHPDLSGFQVYACGAPAMIDAARADFTAAGLPSDEFFADSFTFANDPGSQP